jgi:methylase of polypeptide subunit release factors
MLSRTKNIYGVDVVVNILAEEYNKKFDYIDGQPDGFNDYMPIDGYGHEVLDECLDLIKDWYPDRNFEKCYEWCSGPATLGFGILANNLCKSLCLADIYKPSVDAIKETISTNKLSNVSVYHGHNLDALPSTEKFDLIISNPPHFANPIYQYKYLNERIYVDKDWELHKEFFANIQKHLLKDAKIILFESAWGSNLETFKPMIESAGLKIGRHGYSRTRPELNYYWYLEITN